MVQVLVRFWIALVILMSLTATATALSFTEDTTPEFIFEQGENASIIFTCVDVNDFVCDSTFSCNMTVIYPNSSILVDNQQATQQTNYYNLSLPSTSTLGIHQYNVFCVNATAAGASTELTYLVNLTGEELSVSKTILYIFVLLVTLALFGLCLFGAIKIPWNNKTDDDGFIVDVTDLKYVKLVLWFMTYLFLIFITWLTASISKFLELGMASGFFDLLYLALLVGIFPIFVIIFLIGYSKVFNDKKINELLGRNLKVR